jgi:pilus assembly protein CpaB
MDVKKAVLLSAAFIIAITAALLARSMFSSDPAASGAPGASAASVPAEALGPKVLVATKALPVGTIVTAESFRFQPWPKELVESAYFLQDPAKPENNVDLTKLMGSVVRNAITAGQPLTQGSLIHPGERGYLAAALGPGMRAVTVPVSAQSSVAGFIFPGDRVDLVLTQSVAGNAQDSNPLRVAETIIRNLRVLATDQRMSAEGEDGKPQVQPYSNVTVEVTPKIAEKIAVAQTVGTLSLSLRSIADNTADLDSAIAGSSIVMPKGNDPKAEKLAMAKIAAGPIDRGTTFSTGADVSRYQRRSAPPMNSATPTGAPGSSQPGQMPGGGMMGGVAPQSVGPIVRVARGTSVTETPVGGK